MPKKVRRSVNVIKIVTELAKQRLLWEPLVSYNPVDRYYVGLARDPEFEAWLLTWLPGQGTDWHNHGGSAGAFITLGGMSWSGDSIRAVRHGCQSLTTTCT